MAEAAAETTAPAKEKGERRSARGSTRQDTERSATTQQVRAERAGDRARGAKAEAAVNRERRQRERETARGEAAGKIEKLAARMKLDLAANLRDTRKAETLREEWRWKIVPGEMGQTLDRWLRREGAEEGRGRGAGVRRKTMYG